MTDLIFGLVCILLGAGAGWYLKSQFGTKVAAEAASVQTAASNVAADIKKL